MSSEGIFKNIPASTELSLEYTAKIIKLIFDSPNFILTKKQIGEKLDIAEKTIWRHLSKANLYLSSIPDFEELTKGTTSVGLQLTAFGRKVAKKMEDGKMKETESQIF